MGQQFPKWANISLQKGNHKNVICTDHAYFHNKFMRWHVVEDGDKNDIRWRQWDLCVLCFCVVIFFWSSGIMECTCMLFKFENGVPLMRLGASVLWHHSLLLMNGFNKTEAAVFLCKLCFLRAFPFISFLYQKSARKSRNSRTHSNHHYQFMANFYKETIHNIS